MKLFLSVMALEVGHCELDFVSVFAWPPMHFILNSWFRDSCFSCGKSRLFTLVTGSEVSFESEILPSGFISFSNWAFASQKPLLSYAMISLIFWLN